MAAGHDPAAASTQGSRADGSHDTRDVIGALPCPFCGNESLKVDPPVDRRERATNHYSYVWCPACHCEGPNCGDTDEAVKKWNERSLPIYPWQLIRDSKEMPEKCLVTGPGLYIWFAEWDAEYETWMLNGHIPHRDLRSDYTHYMNIPKLGGAA